MRLFLPPTLYLVLAERELDKLESGPLFWLEQHQDSGTRESIASLVVPCLT